GHKRHALNILRMPSTASDTVACVDFAVAEAQRILELDDLRNDRTLRRVLRTEVPTPSGCPHAVAVTDARGVGAGRELVQIERRSVFDLARMESRRLEGSGIRRRATDGDCVVA